MYTARRALIDMESSGRRGPQLHVGEWSEATPDLVQSACNDTKRLLDHENHLAMPIAGLRFRKRHGTNRDFEPPFGWRAPNGINCRCRLLPAPSPCPDADPVNRRGVGWYRKSADPSP